MCCPETETAETVKISNLKKIPTLACFSDEDLSSLVKICSLKKYEKGELILQEGKYDTLIFFLVYGRVRIEKQGKCLAELKRRGDIFGEMSGLDYAARSATALAVERTACLAVDSFFINQMSGQEKTMFLYLLYRLMAEFLAERLRIADQEIIRLKQNRWKFWRR